MWAGSIGQGIQSKKTVTLIKCSRFGFHLVEQASWAAHGVVAAVDMHNLGCDSVTV